MKILSQFQTPRRFSVSTWSLHHTLGSPGFYGVGQEIQTASHGRGELSLLELPERLAEFGIRTVEICHFHLPSRDDEYLEQLRAALDEAGVELWSLLVDDGDLAHPEHSERDAEWIAEWLPVAQKLGAKRMRVIAGKTKGDEAMARSVKRMRTLVEGAQAHGLRLMTENWGSLLSTPIAVYELLEALNGDVGLCFDFGNWDGPNKYENLTTIAYLAESCHAKAHFEPGQVIDKVDYQRCIEITREAGFSGPYTLIYASPGDEWRGLEIEMGVVWPYL